MKPERTTAPLTDQSFQDELEAQSSRLLREHSQRYMAVEHPFYAGSSLRQMSRREETLARRELRPSGCPNDRATLLLDALCTRLEISDLNRVLLELARQGLTAAEIGEALELSAKAVRARLSRIVRRLRHLVQTSDGLPKLLAEAYQEQLHPERYRPEQHCDSGREACRKDGQCRYRWYLYHITAEDKAE